MLWPIGGEGWGRGGQRGGRGMSWGEMEPRRAAKGQLAAGFETGFGLSLDGRTG